MQKIIVSVGLALACPLSVLQGVADEAPAPLRKSVPAIRIVPMDPAAPAPPLEEPKPAQFVDLKALLNGLKGKTYMLSDGKLVKKDARPNAENYIIYFSASWCGPCCATIKHSVELYNKHIKDNPKLELIMCNRDNTPQKAEAWAAANKMPWAILHKDEATPQVTQLRGAGIPWMVLVNSEGKVLGSVHGMRMQQLIDKVMGSPASAESNK